MADQEQKALQLMAEADKKMKSSSGFLSNLFGYCMHSYILEIMWIYDEWIT